jgi:hypothetical protein
MIVPGVFHYGWSINSAQISFLALLTLWSGLIMALIQPRLTSKPLKQFKSLPVRHIIR